MATENYNAILKFQVQGLETLGQAATRLQKLDTELADLATRAQTLAGGRSTPRQAEADLRSTFRQNQEAMTSFMTGLDTGSRRGARVFQTMSKQAAELGTSITRLSNLQRILNGQVGLPSRASASLAAENALLRQAGLRGSIQRAPAGGFYGVAESGQVLGLGPGGAGVRTRQAAVKAVVEAEIAQVRRLITSYLAESAGTIVGSAQKYPAFPAAPARGLTYPVQPVEPLPVSDIRFNPPPPTRLQQLQQLQQRRQAELEVQRAEQLFNSFRGVSRVDTGDTTVQQRYEQALRLRAAAEERLAGQAQQNLSTAERLEQAQRRQAERTQAELAARRVPPPTAPPIYPGEPYRGAPLRDRIPGLETYPVRRESLTGVGTVAVGAQAEYAPLSDAERLMVDSVERRKRVELEREQVAQAAAQIEKSALRRLETDPTLTPAGRYVGGRQQFTPGQVEQVLFEELTRRRADLGDAFGEVTRKVRSAGARIVSVEQEYERYGEHIASLRQNERLVYGYQTSGPLAQRIAGFGTDFSQGFRGRRELPYAEQLGQVAKFSLLYGTAYQVLYSLSNGLQSAVTQAIEYNAAIRELSIATGRSTSEVSSFAAAVGDISSAVGFSPAAGVQSAARGVGIFGAYDASAVTQEAIGTQFARASSQLAFVTGRTMEQIDQDLGAITQGFELPSAGVGYVRDLDAYFAKRFGSTTGGTLETTAQIGSLGKEAGFAIEEIQAFASLLQSRTGQTPAATAGFLSQVLGRSGDPALRQKFSELGIDISQPFRDQLEQLSGLLESNTLGEGLRNQIINAFGRGRSGQAASIITDEFSEVMRVVEEARSGDASGAAQSAFDQRMKSVAGQLQQLQGNLAKLATNIGESGLLRVIGLAVKGFDALVSALNLMIEAVNLIPSGFREVALTAGLAALALRTQLGKSLIGSALTRAGPGGLGLAQQLGYGIALGPEGNYINQVPTRLDYRNALRGAPRQVSFDPLGAETIGYRDPNRLGNASRAAGSALLSLINPVTLAIGGLIAIGEIRSQADEFRSQMIEATALLGTPTGNDPASLAQQAKVLEGAQAPSPGLLLTIASIGQANASASELASVLRARAEAYQRYSEEEAAYLESRSSTTGAFGTESIDDFATGLSIMSSEGDTAVQQFNSMTRALRDTTDAASAANVQLNLLPGRITRAFGESLGEVDFEALGLGETSRFDNLVNLLNENPITPIAGNFIPQQRVGNAYSEQDLQGVLQTQLEASGLEDRLKSRLEEGPLSEQEFNAIIADTVAGFDFSTIGTDKQTPEEQAALRESFTTWIQEQLAGTYAQFDPAKVYSPAEVSRLIDEILRPQLEAKLGELSALGYESGSSRYDKAIKQYIESLQATNTTEPSGKLRQQIQQARVLLAESVITRLEGQREIAQEAAKSDEEFRRIGRRYLKQELRTALASKSLTLIKQVIALGSKNVTNLVRAQVRVNLEAARAAYQAALNAINVTQAGAEIITGATKTALVALAAARKKVEGLRKTLGLLNEAAKSTLPTGEALIPPDDLEPDEEEGPTAAQIAAARKMAEATRRGGGIALATAQIQVARADLAAAEAGTIEYYQALQSLYEAQRSLAEAIRQYKVDQFLLQNDFTDPVIQARAEQRRARSQLRYDQRQGASVDQITADRLAYQQAQASVDAAKFQQWLSDIQTAEQLEKISHSQYIRMLERRADRLKDIKNRTRQEQDQLNQVLLALKAAQEATSAQFNLGDIRVPTPYEVRRFIELQAAGARKAAIAAGAVGGVDNGRGNVTNNNINIDGADVGTIKQVLRELLGAGAIRRSSTKVSKV